MMKVLVVDDDPAVRAVLASTFAHMGLAVSQAATGAEALANSRLEIPDVILLDVHMPEMNGFEVLRRLRESPVTQSTPVVMICGLPMVKAEAGSMAFGSTHYLTKPWSTDVLMATVRVAMREGMAVAGENDEGNSSVS